MAEVKEALITVTATITRELERSFTQDELAEAGGIQAAKASVVLEAARYGTIVSEDVVARVSFR